MREPARQGDDWAQGGSHGMSGLAAFLLAVVLLGCNGDGEPDPLLEPGTAVAFLQNLDRHHDRTLELARLAAGTGDQELAAIAAELRDWVAEESRFISAALAGPYASLEDEDRYVPEGAATDEALRQAGDDPLRLAALLARHLQAGVTITEPVTAWADADPELVSFAHRSTEEHLRFADQLREPEATSSV